MSLLQCFTLFLGISSVILPASSVCTTQKFTGDHVYTNCNDLPALDAYLRWTYDAAKSSLFIAFTAPPAKPDGWIAWAINPIGKGMPGAQALIAFKLPNGSVTMATYNLASYKYIVPSNLSFGVSDMRAESSESKMTIFAALKLPADMARVNQVWQVGGAVSNGMPETHDFAAANYNARGSLDFTKATRTPVSEKKHSGGDSLIPMSRVVLIAIIVLAASTVGF